VIPGASVTSGLASNLIAEGVGLVAGLIVTYVIVDRIVSARQRASYEPLREHVCKAIDEERNALSFWWARRLGLLAEDEAKSDPWTRDFSAKIASLVAPGRGDLGNTLARVLDAKDRRIIGDETAHVARGVSGLLDRWPQFLVSDQDLRVAVVEFEREARALEYLRDIGREMDDRKAKDLAESAIPVKSWLVFERLCTLSRVLHGNAKPAALESGR
jgi:hypothetical protein